MRRTSLLLAALLAVAGIQLRHQGRPVILRTTCTLLVPLLSGMLCHLLLCRTAYELGSGLLPQLWKDGQTLTCGGVVAGGLAVGCETLLSKVVSIIVFVVLLLAALLGALHMTPQEAAERVRSYGESLRRDEDDDFDDLPEDFTPASAPVSEKKPAAASLRQSLPGGTWRRSFPSPSAIIATTVFPARSARRSTFFLRTCGRGNARSSSFRPRLSTGKASSSPGGFRPMPSGVSLFCG